MKRHRSLPRGIDRVRPFLFAIAVLGSGVWFELPVGAQPDKPANHELRKTDEVSAAAVVASLRTSPVVAELRKERPGQPIVGLYEGFEASIYSTADEVAQAREAAKAKGLYNGMISKMVTVDYTRPAPPDLAVAKTPEQAAEIVTSATGFVLSIRKDGVIEIQDKALAALGDKWFLNRPLGKAGTVPMRLTEAIDLLTSQFHLAPDVFVHHDKVYGNGAVWTGTESDQTARGLLCSILLLMARVKQHDFNFQVVPFAKGQIAITRVAPIVSAADVPPLGGWTIGDLFRWRALAKPRRQ